MRRSFTGNAVALLLALTVLACFPEESQAPSQPTEKLPPLSLAGSKGLQLVSTEIRVTSSSESETTPTLGSDGASNVVVFASRAATGNAQVYYQRIGNTQRIGPAVLISEGGTNDELTDISGDYVVYTSYVSPTSELGEVKLYEISSGTSRTISELTTIFEARVHDRMIAWIEGTLGSTRVMLFNLDGLVRGERPIEIAGPNPPASDLEIGERLVVWTERVGTQFDVVAYDMQTSARVGIATDPTRNERAPSTSGTWITWQSSANENVSVRVQAINFLGGELRTVADNGAVNISPTIDGDIIAYESNVAGNFDVYLYRVSDAQTFRVTDHPADQQLNNVFGSMVAYVDSREELGDPRTESPDTDVFVTAFSFETADATPPELVLPENISLAATSRDGAVVAYTVAVTDNFDPSPDVSCAPPSGSVFPLGVTRVDCTAADEAGNRAAGSFVVTVNALSAEIDVNPGSPPFPIRLSGPLPVISVILRTTGSLDAAMVEPGTATLGDGSGMDAAVMSLRGRVLATLVDVDRDGDKDLVLAFNKSELVQAGDLARATAELVFRAELRDGRPVRGADVVQVVP